MHRIAFIGFFALLAAGKVASAAPALNLNCRYVGENRGMQSTCVAHADLNAGEQVAVNCDGAAVDGLSTRDVSLADESLSAGVSTSWLSLPQGEPLQGYCEVSAER